MTKATDNASKSVANANTVSILESIPRAFTIANTKPINAIAPTKANITAAIAPTCLISIDFELLTMTKATDNASKSVANANTVPILESIPRAFTIANTRPINAIAPTKASITAAIASTCFLSIDLALLAINKAVDKAIISKANDPAASMQESTFNS